MVELPKYDKWEEVPANLKTKTQLGELGLKLGDGQKPEALKTAIYGDYFLYDMNKAIPKRKVVMKEPVPLPLTIENIAFALYTINKAAKRRRDGSTSAYEGGGHVLARLHKNEKEKLYMLKDKALQKAISDGIAKFEGMHMQTREVERKVHDDDTDYDSYEWETREETIFLSCYSIGEFRFHTIMEQLPKDNKIEIEDLGAWTSEATPRGTLKIKDAIATLEKYLHNGIEKL